MDPRIILLIAVYVLTMAVRLMVQSAPREHGAVVALALGTAIVASLMIVDSAQQLVRGVTAAARVVAVEDPHSSSPLYGLTGDQVRAKIGAPSMTNGATWYYDSSAGTRWVRFKDGRLVDEGGPTR